MNSPKDKKVVKLKVYKNNIEKRRKSEFVKGVQQDIKDITSAMPDFNGYALVVWNDAGEFGLNYNQGNVSAFEVPELVKQLLLGEIVARSQTPTD